MDGTDERQSSPQESARTRRALEGDWSEGLPGPAHAHGLPAPEPLGLPVRDEAAPSPMPAAAAESVAEPAVEAPADWGGAADPSLEAASGAAPAGEADDDFPVTLSEADEIQEETTAPIDLGPFEDTAVEEMPAEEALAQMEAASAPVDAGPPDGEDAPPEAVAPEPEGLPPEFAAPPAEFKAAPEATAEEAAPGAAADWLAHPDSTAPAPATTWEEATFATESTMDSAFAAAEAASAPAAEAEVDLSFGEPPAEAAPTDAWGEPTVAAEAGPPDIEAWAAPVETPVQVSPAPPAQGLSAASEFVNMPPPKEGGELTEEPPEPEWSQGPRELFSPLPTGASLSDDDVTSEAALSPDAGGEGTLDRATPSRLELVRGPETLEDADLLVPVEDATPPHGVVPVPPPPPVVVEGEQRVAIHTRAGQTRRGTVTDLDLSQSQIPLAPQGGGDPETIDHTELKAIFFMLAPGEKPEAANGQAVRITFSDGRSIEGHRQGEESSQGFFLVPLDAQRTNTRRIYVARDAVAEMEDL